MARGRPSVRRRQVLSFIQDTIAANGIAPSYGMICDALNIGTRSEVRRIVIALECAGELRRAGRGRVRRINLTNYAH